MRHVPKIQTTNLRTLFMDREFLINPTISTLQGLNKNQVIAVKSKKINAMLFEHKKKFGQTSTFFEYQCEKVVIVIHIQFVSLKLIFPRHNYHNILHSCQAYNLLHYLLQFSV